MGQKSRRERTGQEGKDMKQGDLFSVQMYADIPWVMATGGQKGELAIWDTEEDATVLKHFKNMMPSKAKHLKKKADKGFEATDTDMVEADGADSSGFEDVDSDDEEDSEAATQEEMKESPQEGVPSKAASKSSSSNKKSSAKKSKK